MKVRTCTFRVFRLMTFKYLMHYKTFRNIPLKFITPPLGIIIHFFLSSHYVYIAIAWHVSFTCITLYTV